MDRKPKFHYPASSVVRRRSMLLPEARIAQCSRPCEEISLSGSCEWTWHHCYLREVPLSVFSFHRLCLAPPNEPNLSSMSDADKGGGGQSGCISEAEGPFVLYSTVLPACRCWLQDGKRAAPGEEGALHRLAAGPRACNVDAASFALAWTLRGCSVPFRGLLGALGAIICMHLAEMYREPFSGQRQRRLQCSAAQRSTYTAVQCGPARRAHAGSGRRGRIGKPDPRPRRQIQPSEAGELLLFVRPAAVRDRLTFHLRMTARLFGRRLAMTTERPLGLLREGDCDIKPSRPPDVRERFISASGSARAPLSHVSGLSACSGNVREVTKQRYSQGTAPRNGWIAKKEVGRGGATSSRCNATVMIGSKGVVLA